MVGLEKLKGKFKPFEARRALMREHELFLADERVMGLMPQLLGKVFYDSKKSVAISHFASIDSWQGAQRSGQGGIGDG